MTAYIDKVNTHKNRTSEMMLDMQEKHISYIWKISALLSLIGIVGILGLQVGSWLTVVPTEYMFTRPVEVSVDDITFVLPLGGGVSGHLMAFVRAYRLHWLLHLSRALAIGGGVIFLASFTLYKHAKRISYLN